MKLQGRAWAQPSPDQGSWRSNLPCQTAPTLTRNPVKSTMISSSKFSTITTCTTRAHEHCASHGNPSNVHGRPKIEAHSRFCMSNDRILQRALLKRHRVCEQLCCWTSTHVHLLPQLLVSHYSLSFIPLCSAIILLCLTTLSHKESIHFGASSLHPADQPHPCLIGDEGRDQQAQRAQGGT